MVDIGSYLSTNCGSRSPIVILGSEMVFLDPKIVVLGPAMMVMQPIIVVLDLPRFVWVQ